MTQQLQPTQVIDAAKLNRRVQIQSPSSATDGFGQATNTWNTVYTCWASISVRSMELVYATSGFISKATHYITIRWTSSLVLQPNMRVLFTEPVTRVVHTYLVDTLLNPDQRNRQIVLLVYELDATE